MELSNCCDADADVTLTSSGNPHCTECDEETSTYPVGGDHD